MHNNEFINLGNIFRQRRLEKNLSLKEVENATSIRLHYLVAIEEGHLGKLISPVYARGFIRKYATLLDIDCEALLQEHPQVLEQLSYPRDHKEEFAYGVGTLEMRGNSEAPSGNSLNFLWIGLSIFILISGWFLARYIGIL